MIDRQCWVCGGGGAGLCWPSSDHVHRWPGGAQHCLDPYNVTTIMPQYLPKILPKTKEVMFLSKLWIYLYWRKVNAWQVGVLNYFMLVCYFVIKYLVSRYAEQRINCWKLLSSWMSALIWATYILLIPYSSQKAYFDNETYRPISLGA